MTTTIPDDDDFSTNDTVERLAQAAHKAIDRAAAKAEAFGELNDEWLDSAKSCVQERPLTSLLVAVAAGMLIDRLLR